MSWLVERYDVRDLAPERREAVTAWVVRHGVDVLDVMPKFTVSATDDGVLQLHLSQFHRVDGEKTVDLNLDVVATTPLVIDINPDDPPPWLIKE